MSVAFPAGSQFIMRWSGPPVKERITVEDEGVVRDIWKNHVASRDWFDGSKETVIVIGLDGRERFLGWHLVSTGSAIGTVCGPRDVLRAALAIDAVSIVVVHNHPSGDPSPSRVDERCTRVLLEACVIFEMRLLDHVIVDSAGETSYSFRAAQLIGEECRPAASTPPPQHECRRTATTTPPERADPPGSPGGASGVYARIPNAVLRRVPEKDLIAALFSRLESGRRGVTAQELAGAWVGGHLQKHLRKMEAFKFQTHVEVVVPTAALPALRTASHTAGIPLDRFLSALVGDLVETWETWQRVEGRAVVASEPPEGKVVPFFPPRRWEAR